jgi:hypothetical protein
MATPTIAASGLTRPDRVVLWLFALVAAAFGVATIVRLVAGIRLYVLSAASGETQLFLLNSVHSDGDVPTEGDPSILFAAQPTTDLLVRGLDDGTRALLAGGEVLSALVALVVSVAIAWLFVSLARGKTFARSLQALALTAGATLALGSLLGQGIAGFGRMNAALALNEALGEERFLVGTTFDTLPLVLGFAIMALAFVFRAGHRLQRDTEGLV